MLGPSICNHRRTCAGAATPLGAAASKLLRLRTRRTRMRQAPCVAHGSMKHVCLKSLQVGQVPVAKVHVVKLPVTKAIVTIKPEDGFAHFETRKPHIGASGDDFLRDGYVACRPGHSAKSGLGSGHPCSFC